MINSTRKNVNDSHQNAMPWYWSQWTCSTMSMLNFFQTVLPRKLVFFKNQSHQNGSDRSGCAIGATMFWRCPLSCLVLCRFWLAVYCILHINCADMAFDLHLNMCNVPRKHPQLPPPKLHRRWPKKPRQIARPQIAWQNGRVKGVNTGPLVDRISTQWAR